jgi:N6-L-threonylcarbamoyladenine synthase
MVGRDDGAYSFSGLKTAVRMHVEARSAVTGGLDEADCNDLCAAFQATAVEQLVRVTLDSVRRHRLRDLVVAGGVAANGGLRHGLSEACRRAGVRFWPVALPLCTDNAAMIAGLGEALLDLGHRHDPRALDAEATGEVRRKAALPASSGSPP